MEKLRNFIENYVDLSDADWQTISVKFHPQEFRSEQVILRQGDICRHLYFLESGLLRFFALHDGEEVTKFFTDAPYLFTSQVSFSKVQPAEENIQALENCTAYVITFQDANELLAIGAWSEFIRKLVQEVQCYTEKILFEMQTVKAEDRYKKMLDENPDLIKRVPLKYLASYLGIHPQSLSRIRKQIKMADRM